MNESIESRQLAFRGVAHEIGRSVVHIAHQAVAVADDLRAAAPGDRRGEEARDLPVGGIREAVRNRNGIVGDELRAVIGVLEPFEQLAERLPIKGSVHRTW